MWMRRGFDHREKVTGTAAEAEAVPDQILGGNAEQVVRVGIFDEGVDDVALL